MSDLSYQTGRLFQMYDEISFIKKQGVSSSIRLHELFGRISDAHRGINARMVNQGEVVSSDVEFGRVEVKSQMVDYALRHFGVRVCEGECALPLGLKNLLQFKSDVERFKGKRLETFEGDVLKENGTNLGELSFEVKRTFRNLYVVCEKNVFVNPDIFVENLSRMEGAEGVVWATFYQTRKHQYVGGGPPADFRLVLGHGCSEYGGE